MTQRSAMGDAAASEPPVATDTAARNTRLRRRTRPSARFAMPVILAAVILIFWQYGVRALGIPSYLIPRAWPTFVALADGFQNGAFVSDTFATLEEVIVGFAIGAAAGVFLGACVAWSRALDATFTPYILGVNALPKIAVAPLIVLWLGQGLNSKVVITALICFFPVVVNVTAGLRSVTREQIDLMRSLTASRWQVLTKVQVKAALPQTFAGLLIAITLAPVGAIVGEFVGAHVGLGYSIEESITLVQPSTEFADFLILTAMSLVLYLAIRQIGAKVVFWQPRDPTTMHSLTRRESTPLN